MLSPLVLKYLALLVCVEYQFCVVLGVVDDQELVPEVDVVFEEGEKSGDSGI